MSKLHCHNELASHHFTTTMVVYTYQHLVNYGNSDVVLFVGGLIFRSILMMSFALVVKENNQNDLEIAYTFCAFCRQGDRYFLPI